MKHAGEDETGICRPALQQVSHHAARHGDDWLRFLDGTARVACCPRRRGSPPAVQQHSVVTTCSLGLWGPDLLLIASPLIAAVSAIRSATPPDVASAATEGPSCLRTQGDALSPLVSLFMMLPSARSILDSIRLVSNHEPWCKRTCYLWFMSNALWYRTTVVVLFI